MSCIGCCRQARRGWGRRPRPARRRRRRLRRRPSPARSRSARSAWPLAHSRCSHAPLQAAMPLAEGSGTGRHPSAAVPSLAAVCAAVTAGMPPAALRVHHPKTRSIRRALRASLPAGLLESAHGAKVASLAVMHTYQADAYEADAYGPGRYIRSRCIRPRQMHTKQMHTSKADAYEADAYVPGRCMRGRCIRSRQMPLKAAPRCDRRQELAEPPGCAPWLGCGL